MRLTRRRLAVSLGASALLAACSSSDKPKVAALETFQPRITGRQVWQARVGGVGFPLVIATRGGHFTVAGDDGSVAALNAEDGRELWRGSAGTTLSAGVGSDGRYAAVVTRNNEVVTFDAGREVWRRRVPSRVVTAPLVAGERVFVLAVDRSVHAFDAADGRRLWVLQRPGDALTLAQGGVVTSYRNLLLVGQGSRLTAVDPTRGTVTWEVPMSTPRGTNEVERLADLVGPVVRSGTRVCARAFQNAVACADAERNGLLWTRNVGGTQAVAGNDDFLFGADASDRITAWKAGSGDIAWTNERLLNRGLSGPAALGRSVVFGDAEGYLHFLDAASGEMQLRLATGGGAVVGTPALLDQTLLVATRSGGLYAFRPQ